MALNKSSGIKRQLNKKGAFFITINNQRQALKRYIIANLF